jgi:hypothetical protein
MDAFGINIQNAGGQKGPRQESRFGQRSSTATLAAIGKLRVT